MLPILIRSTTRLNSEYKHVEQKNTALAGHQDLESAGLPSADPPFIYILLEAQTIHVVTMGSSVDGLFRTLPF